MKHLHVVAAIIIHNNRVFATQRGYGPMKGGWEFPGGKIEPGETPEEALHREIREELDIDIKIDRLFETVNYDYPDFHLTMQCYCCTVTGGDMVLKEHTAARWLSPGELESVAWLPADMSLVGHLKATLTADSNKNTHTNGQ